MKFVPAIVAAVLFMSLAVVAAEVPEVPTAPKTEEKKRGK